MVAKRMVKISFYLVRIFYNTFQKR